jgi:group I intron endonuclease
MDKKYNFKVYAHISPSGKFYIGVTSQKPNRRWRFGKGYKHNEYFYNAILKYGWDNFQHEIIADNLSEDEAKNFEITLINKLKTLDREFGYNRTTGGDGVTGSKCPEWKKQKMRETMKGEGNPMYGISLEGKSGVDNPMYGKPSKHRKRVMCINTGEIFDCVTHASEKYKTYRSDINKNCRGIRTHAGKLNGEPLLWRYIDED